MNMKHLMKKYTKGKLWKNVGYLSLICQKSKSNNTDSKFFEVFADQNFLWNFYVVSKLLAQTLFQSNI